MKINHQTLTEEQLIEFVEYIDWSMVPKKLLTDKIKEFFIKDFKGLEVRLWFEDLFSKMIIKEDQEKYPDIQFFFIDDKFYMELDFKTGDLWCSYWHIWLFFETKMSYNYDETQLFIKNVVEQHFKNGEVTPSCRWLHSPKQVEQHLKNM